MATSHSTAAAHDRLSEWPPGLVDYEARLIARTVASYGALERGQLYALTHAERWHGASFATACALAVERGLIRNLGFGFYASPRHDA